MHTGLYGTYHMVNTGGFCSRFEFAQKILEYAGIQTAKSNRSVRRASLCRHPDRAWKRRAIIIWN